MLKKLAKQILQIMNQLNHSDMNSSCLILKRSFIEISFKASESNDFSIISFHSKFLFLLNTLKSNFGINSF